jgi:catechol 2,3-dioxygenase-like lactoylglutathione lyase family enzyme
MDRTPIQTVKFGRAAPGICVRDIQAAYAFYSGVFGFRKVFENGDPVGFMVLKKDGAEIHLNQHRDHCASTINVLHMFVDDVATLYAICEAAGVRIIKSLRDKDYGQRAFVFADPDGNRIDVGERIGATSAL